MMERVTNIRMRTKLKKARTVVKDNKVQTRQIRTM
jgi:hypothetical protein